jgi:glycine/D-amino acid oxidase-like deaminating enzyme
VETHFRSPGDVARLSEKVIVNCTGLGSRRLFNDSDMAPIKGQLVRLQAQSNLEYLFSGDGYVFPRSDAVIVGGTTECNVDNDIPVDAKCIEMVDWMKRVFAGKRLLFAGRPKDLIRGK